MGMTNSFSDATLVTSVFCENTYKGNGHLFHLFESTYYMEVLTKVRNELKQSKTISNELKRSTRACIIKYICLHGILPFSKSYPEIESTWPTAKCRERKSFETWYHIVTCATLCVSFSSKSKASNIFPKQILKSKALGKSIQATRKLFCHVIIKNCLCNVSWKFLIKIKTTWRREIKEQAPQLTLHYLGRTARSSHRRCCLRKLFLKILQCPKETPVLESIFKKVADL